MFCINNEIYYFMPKLDVAQLIKSYNDIQNDALFIVFHRYITN